MHHYSVLVLALVLIGAQAVCQETQAGAALPDTLLFTGSEQENDTLEYELIIFSAEFESWFNRVHTPKEHYSESYLQSWNKQLADQWNYMRHSPRRPGCMPESYLDYDPEADYGKELNHRLFYFFRFMHERCRIFRVYPRRW